jgi:hypothetical protein
MENITQIINSLRKLRSNTETYFKNSIRYGAVMKSPFINSAWVYDMNTNFLEYIKLYKEEEKTLCGPRFMYYPPNKANKEYIVLSRYIVCNTIRVFTGSELQRTEKAYSYAEKIWPELKKAIDEELKYWTAKQNVETSNPLKLF